MAIDSKRKIDLKNVPNIAEIIHVIFEVEAHRVADLKIGFCEFCLGSHVPEETQYKRTYGDSCNKCNLLRINDDNQPHEDWCPNAHAEGAFCCGAYCDGFTPPLGICERFKLDKFHLAQIVRKIRKDAKAAKATSHKAF